VDTSFSAAAYEGSTAEDVSAAVSSSSVTKPQAQMQAQVKVTWEQWKIRLFASTKPPTAQQWRVLEEIYKRATVEQHEFIQNSRSKSQVEPLRMLVQGLPGAGKSQVIQWIRSLFEEVLGYTHGIEFVCVASMNTMAALIGGMTLHAWGEIPITDEQSVAKASKRRDKADISTMFVKCQSLRWILIDEGSSAGCESLGIMESNVRGNVRKAADTYTMRPKKRGVAAEPRAWGGMNVLFFVDMWQLPPVRQTPIFNNPFTVGDHRVQRLMNMFWTRFLAQAHFGSSSR